MADSNDQDPVFEYESCPRVGSFCANPEYRASVTSGEVSGVLAIKPERIKAMDLDSLSASIRYYRILLPVISVALIFTCVNEDFVLNRRKESIIFLINERENLSSF